MSDNDVERWVTEELHWDPKLDSNAIAVSANDGEVTLRGTVGSFREKRDAEKTAQRVYGVRTVTNDLKVRLLTEHGRDDADYLAGNVLGVLGVDDQIDLTHTEPGAGDVQEAIRKAFKRNAKIDADDVSVDTRDGTVVLTGSVRTWAEHDEALAAAWAAPGVTGVDDYLEVDY